MKTKEGLVVGLAEELAGKYPDACREKLVKVLRTLGSVIRAYESSSASQEFVHDTLTLDEGLHRIPGLEDSYDRYGGRIGDLVGSQ